MNAKDPNPHTSDLTLEELLRDCDPRHEQLAQYLFNRPDRPLTSTELANVTCGPHFVPYVLDPHVHTADLPRFMILRSFRTFTTKPSIPDDHRDTPSTWPTPSQDPQPRAPLPPWARRIILDLTHNDHIFGTQRKPMADGLRTTRWFYGHNTNHPHPVTHRPRYYCEANMWYIADKLGIPERTLRDKIRALERYGFLWRHDIASKTGKERNLWQIAHTPEHRAFFYAQVLRGRAILASP